MTTGIVNVAFFDCHVEAVPLANITLQHTGLISLARSTGIQQSRSGEPINNSNETGDCTSQFRQPNIAAMSVAPARADSINRLWRKVQ